MSYTKFVNLCKSYEIKKPYYILHEKKNFPAKRIFVSIDEATEGGLLAQNAKKCDVAFVSQLDNSDVTLSIFIEEKSRTASFSDVRAQLTSTINQMKRQGIFDKRGKEKVSLVVYSEKSPSRVDLRKMRQGIPININGEKQIIEILRKKIMTKNQPALWEKAYGAAQTF